MKIPAVDLMNNPILDVKGDQIMIPPFLREDHLNAFCFQYAYNNHPQTRGLLFHVPNEVQVSGNLGVKLRADNKAKGVVSGIPDFIFFYQGRLFAFEGKLGNKPISKSQNDIHNTWIKHGATVFIYRDFYGFYTSLLKAMIHTQGVPPEFRIDSHGLYIAPVVIHY